MNCHSDMLIFQKIKNGISERNSVLNNSLICCNGIMHCGTTIDNLEWMGRAARWSKFTATASVGMIHNKHLSESMNILSQHLPGSGGGPYQEGGALYALGLIHFGDNSDVTMARAYYGTLSIEQRRTYSWTTPIQAHIIESGNDRFPRPKYQNYDSNTSDLFIANESDNIAMDIHRRISQTHIQSLSELNDFNRNDIAGVDLGIGTDFAAPVLNSKSSFRIELANPNDSPFIKGPRQTELNHMDDIEFDIGSNSSNGEGSATERTALINRISDDLQNHAHQFQHMNSHHKRRNTLTKKGTPKETHTTNNDLDLTQIKYVIRQSLRDG